MGKKEITEVKVCKNEKCKRKFKPEKDNPGQEYCSLRCWKVVHGVQ